jgi:hypothetical protein
MTPLPIVWMIVDVYVRRQPAIAFKIIPAYSKSFQLNLPPMYVFIYERVRGRVLLVIPICFHSHLLQVITIRSSLDKDIFIVASWLK